MTETLKRALREAAVYDRQADDAEVAATIEAMGCPQSIDLFEKMLKYYKARLNDILSRTIPDELHAAGVSKIELETGETVSIDRYYSLSYASGPGASDDEKEENKEAFYAWLKGNGYGDIVKTRETYGVHPSTLKKWAREVIENSLASPPESIATVNVFERATIKKGKI